MTLASYLNSQFSMMQTIDFFIRIIIACLCGACIGFERSKRLKEAGIRTHIIVCCASALMMIISKYGFVDLTSAAGHLLESTRGADGSRIASQVISGISFLGAGVIFKNGNSIKGLTTAAGIWATAGIGLAIGAGMFTIGIFTTIIIAILQIVMHKFTVGTDSLISSHIQFTVLNREAFQIRLSEYITENQAQVLESKVSFDHDGNAVYDMVMRTPHDISVQDLSLFFSSDDVKSIDCMPVA